MLFDDNTYELIDKYLSGELKGKSLDKFEKQIETDPELAQEVESQKEIIELLDEHEKTAKIKAKLENIHDDIDVDEVRKKLPELIVVTRKKKVLRTILTIAVAASVSIIAVTGTLYTSGWFNYGQHEKTYKILSNKIDNISSYQKSLWDELISSKEDDEEPPVIFNGTSFSVSPNGYLVTNYHVVKNVDSIFIVNKLDTLIRYKVELIHKDPVNDLAILKVIDENFQSFGTLPFIFKEKISGLGEYVYTLGYSKEGLVFGEGSISSLTGYKEDTTAYQISIPVNPGNSGGPLIDEKGNILGIISGKHSQKEGAAFAVRSNYLISLIDSMEVDSLTEPPVLPKRNLLRWKKRSDQINKLQPFIYKVEVYNNE